MSHRNLLVFLNDGMQAPAIGAYGATWAETPHLDEWAAKSYVLDQFRADSLSLTELYSGMFTGTSSIAPKRFAMEPLPTALASAGYHTHLITDDPVVADWAESFSSADVLPFLGNGTAASVDDVQSTKLLALAAMAAAKAPQPFLLWIHAQGMYGPWDAPYDMRQSFADDDDPPPPTDHVPPRLQLPRDIDPDWLVGWRMGYMAQVKALDHAWGEFGPALLESLGSEGTSVFGAPRGFRLGLHGVFGDFGEAMHEECLHTPLWITSGRREGALDRSSQLAQPCDLHFTLRELAGLSASPLGYSLLPQQQPHTKTMRDRVCGEFGRERFIQTAAWRLRFFDEVDKASSMDIAQSDVSSESMRQPQLFVKPDDRFEVNDVLRISTDITALLEDAWRAEQRALQQSAYARPSPLAKVLTEAQR